MIVGNSWKLMDLKDEELLAHREKFVDAWVEKAFVWILASFIYG